LRNGSLEDVTEDEVVHVAEEGTAGRGEGEGVTVKRGLSVLEKKKETRVKRRRREKGEEGETNPQKNHWNEMIAIANIVKNSTVWAS
jgi:hypothetical protein